MFTETYNESFFKYIEKDLTGRTTGDILSLVTTALKEIILELLDRLRDKASVRHLREKDDKVTKEDKKGRRKKYPTSQKTDFPVRVFRADFFKSTSHSQDKEI